MSQLATLEHACVRVVGPVNGETLVARWPPGCEGADSMRRRDRAVTGTLLAAGVSAPQRWLEAADIVTVSEEGGIGPEEWLLRYPGCAVAVSCVRPGECSVATRNGAVRSMTVSSLGDAGTIALACAVFAHGWIAAGWPLSLLRPACLDVSRGALIPEPEPGRRLFFRFSYRVTPGDGSPPG